ncbi:MAG: VOC family protein [Sulfuricaulis sp.]|nr:VOC family protein [Sulfuricaulis sp.]
MASETGLHQRPKGAQKIASGTRGVHHLALTTDDMKMTTDFFVNVVGMPLVHAMKVPAGLGTGPGNRGNPPYECLRHYFFDMGNDSLLAFFEIPKGAEPAARRDAIGGMQHCAFAVTPGQFEALMARLKKHGVAFDGPFESLPGLHSIYFFDPNGLRLEACYEPAAGNSQRVVSSVLQTRTIAAEELRSVGASAQWLETMTAALPEGD